MSAVKLTDKFVSGFPRPESRVEIPDTVAAGLYLVVQPSGSRSWAVRYRHQGKPKKVTLGCYPTMTLAEARATARQAIGSAAGGNDPAADKKAAAAAEAASAEAEERRKRTTVAAVSVEFIDKWARPNNRTWKETEKVISRYILPEFGDRQIDTVRRPDVVKLIDRLSADIGQPTARAAFAALSRMLAWGLEREMIATNPCTGMKVAAAPSRDRVLSDTELSAIWRAADTEGYPFGHIVKLLILTAQRRDEVGQLRWSEIEINRREWNLPGDRSKNEQGNVIPLAGDAMSVLAAVPRFDSDFLFPARGDAKGTVFSGYSKAKERLDQRSGVKGWRLHDLRRTAATGMARLGFKVETIEKVLNHTSGSLAGVAGVYNRYAYNEEKRAALTAWSAHVMAMVANNG